MSMDTDYQHNGQAPAEPVKVSFGPLPTQELHLEIAEKILTSLKEKHPAIFGALLCEALDIALAKRGRGQ